MIVYLGWTRKLFNFLWSRWNTLRWTKAGTSICFFSILEQIYRLTGGFWSQRTQLQRPPSVHVQASMLSPILPIHLINSFSSTHSPFSCPFIVSDIISFCPKTLTNFRRKQSLCWGWVWDTEAQLPALLQSLCKILFKLVKLSVS